MEWKRVKDELPKISYLESDDYEECYRSFPVLVWYEEMNNEEGIYCVAYLIKNQNENSWNFEQLSWELYVPSGGGDILRVGLSEFTHWMPLPNKPEITTDEKHSTKS